MLAFFFSLSLSTYDFHIHLYSETFIIAFFLPSYAHWASVVVIAHTTYILSFDAPLPSSTIIVIVARAIEAKKSCSLQKKKTMCRLWGYQRCRSIYCLRPQHSYTHVCTRDILQIFHIFSLFILRVHPVVRKIYAIIWWQKRRIKKEEKAKNEILTKSYKTCIIFFAFEINAPFCL